MFWNATIFKQDISTWDVSNVNNMEGMFENASNFNQDLSSWDVSNVTTMNKMFSEASCFNQPIGNWDVRSVIDMRGMFYSDFENPSVFNHDISKWEVNNVTDMREMFFYTKVFNQPIGKWDVSNVIHMESMFEGAEAFNQDLSSWNLDNLTNTEDMFLQAISFNQSKMKELKEVIEDQINTTSEFRENNSIEAFTFGESLCENIKSEMKSLEEILGDWDSNYQIISTKLANEIFLCGLTYFNQVVEDRTASSSFASDKEGNKALYLYRFAKNISFDDQLSLKINEHIHTIEEWLINAPDEKQIEGLIALNELNDIMDEVLELVKATFPNEEEIKKRQVEAEELELKEVIKAKETLEALEDKRNQERIISIKKRKSNKKWWEFWL
jgi:surface protein